MSCIGTAGHVDHGKSTLVTALTGIDPDRLAEEKARGMTIDLGFAWLTLPSGREVSIVDVPGHESFIKNMLAGVGGIDVALLVVAADEGVMPQTDEHLAILDLLRVRSGVVALTKCDLVDEDWLELVREDVAGRLEPTALVGAPIISCSAVTRVGLSELLAALDAALDAQPPRRDLGRPRLPVDRVFSIAGFGTVVTGTLQDGTLRVGQEVEVLPVGIRTRIRGLQAHKRQVEVGAPGGRLAVNLAGVARSNAQRGVVLTLPGVFQPATCADVLLEVTHSSLNPIQHNAVLDVYAGAAEAPARVILLEDDELRPGERGWAQLRLARPLVLARGDHFIVRQPSPSLTIGGGMVLEPLARRHRRRDLAVLQRLAVLAQGDPEEVVAAALVPAAARGPAARGSDYGAREPANLSRLTGLPAEDIAAALDALASRDLVVRAGRLVLATSEWQRLRSDSTRTVGSYHQRFPLRTGMPREEWRSRLRLSPHVSAELIPAMITAGDLAEAPGGRGAPLLLPSHVPTLSADQERAVMAMLERFRAAPFSPPTRPDVETDLGAELTAALVERGALVAIGTILLTPDAYNEAIHRVAAYLREHGTLTVAAARDLLGTSRKYMLPLLEHFDERRITLRRGDDRIAGPNLPAEAPITERL